MFVISLLHFSPFFGGAPAALRVFVFFSRRRNGPNGPPTGPNGCRSGYRRSPDSSAGCLIWTLREMIFGCCMVLWELSWVSHLYLNLYISLYLIYHSPRNTKNIPIPTYPLVNIYELENHHVIAGKIHYFDWVIFNSYVTNYPSVYDAIHIPEIYQTSPRNNGK